MLSFFVFDFEIDPNLMLESTSCVSLLTQSLASKESYQYHIEPMHLICTGPQVLTDLPSFFNDINVTPSSVVIAVAYFVHAKQYLHITNSKLLCDTDCFYNPHPGYAPLSEVVYAQLGEDWLPTADLLCYTLLCVVLRIEVSDLTTASLTPNKRKSPKKIAPNALMNNLVLLRTLFYKAISNQDVLTPHMTATDVLQSFTQSVLSPDRPTW
jgi:hypothetical protein